MKKEEILNALEVREYMLLNCDEFNKQFLNDFLNDYKVVPATFEEMWSIDEEYNTYETNVDCYIDDENNFYSRDEYITKVISIFELLKKAEEFKIDNVLNF